jgi:DNA-binding NtrC family response regulator
MNKSAGELRSETIAAGGVADMRILYLKPEPFSGNTAEFLRQRGYQVVLVSACIEALQMIRSQSFDAVVIGGEDENPEVLDFTVKAHRMQPELPVFLANDWGPELPTALDSLEGLGKAGEVLQG